MSDFDEDDEGLLPIFFQEIKEPKPFTVHWAGGTVIAKRGMVTRIGSGSPACCGGDRAVRIASEGRQTWTRERVTCKQCLKQLDRHDFSARMHPEEKQWPELR